MMIELKNVCKTLGRRPVLRGVNLSVNAGETMMIVGPSGTGKSVTLSHIIGLMRPDSGTVLVDGMNVGELDRRGLEKFRTRIGMLFQGGALLNWLNIYDNVALPLRERTSLSEEQIRAVGVVGLIVASGRFRRKQAHTPDVVLRKEVVQIFIVPHIDEVPVVEPRALDRLIGNVKAERADQVQHASRRRAGSCDVAGIGRNLRLDQNHMQHKTTLPPHKTNLKYFMTKLRKFQLEIGIKVMDFCEKISILRGPYFVHLREFSNQSQENRTKAETRSPARTAGCRKIRGMQKAGSDERTSAPDASDCGSSLFCAVPVFPRG